MGGYWGCLSGVFTGGVYWGCLLGVFTGLFTGGVYWGLINGGVYWEGGSLPGGLLVGLTGNCLLGVVYWGVFTGGCLLADFKSVMPTLTFQTISIKGLITWNSGIRRHPPIPGVY